MAFKISGLVGIDIRLDNGLYVFFPESATGKTRLAKILREVALERKDVLSLTYADYVNRGEALVERINKPLKLLVIDRYDKWVHDGKIKEAIVSHRKDRITLIDLKEASNSIGHGAAAVCVELTPAGVVVEL